MTDTNQDPNYQDILTKYADSLKSTEVPKIPEPEVSSQASPETQLDSVPEVKPESAPTAPPTVLEPDPNAPDLPEKEPETAIMTEMDAKTEVAPPAEPAVSASEMLETASQVDTPAPEIKPETPTYSEPEAPKITQPDVQIPPSMMETPPVDIPPSASIDDFVPPAPHPIEIAPDFVPPPKENHFFKYLFFFSLIVFMVVVALVAYSFVNSQKTLNNLKAMPTIAPPTGVPAKACEINGQEYAINETFTATDGCNTCTCGADLNIVCTEMACDASKSATTSTDTKNYSNSTFAFSFSYPKDLSVVDLLPKQFTKISTTREYLLLEDKSKTLAITLTVNPDGFGPIFSNKDYTLKYQSGKGLISTIKTTNTPDENFDKTKDVYLYSGEINKDFNLLIMVRSSKGLTTSDQIISQILSTFKLSTPTATTAPKATIVP